jgi:hypothetical protein
MLSILTGCVNESLHTGFFGGSLQDIIDTGENFGNNFIWIGVKSQDRCDMGNCRNA